MILQRGILLSRIEVKLCGLGGVRVVGAEVRGHVFNFFALKMNILSLPNILWLFSESYGLPTKYIEAINKIKPPRATKKKKKRK